MYLLLQTLGFSVEYEFLKMCVWFKRIASKTNTNFACELGLKYLDSSAISKLLYYKERKTGQIT